MASFVRTSLSSGAVALVLYLSLLNSLSYNNAVPSFVQARVAFEEYLLEAEYALKQLQKLSDSGVYESLSLGTIIDAYREEGIFHHNTVMRVELKSPYYMSNMPSEVFNIIVMKHKDDGLLSFAIDAFPMMTDEAVEEYMIKKIKRRRQQREEAFRKLELEAAHFLQD